MTLVYLGVAWLAGLLLADCVAIPPLILALVALWSAAVALLERAAPQRRRIALLVLVAVAGALRWQAAHPPVSASDLAFYNDSGTLVVEGYVSGDPIRRETRQQVVLRAESLTVEGVRTAAAGKVLITTSLYPAYRYGQRLAVTGKLETPPVLEDFDYAEYLAAQGIGSVIRRATIQVLPGQGGSAIMAVLSAVRESLRLSIERILPYPEAGLLQGILLGLDHTLPEDLADAFRAAGLTHIIVISGFNISILLQGWFATATRLMHRWFALIAGLLVLGVFVILVGPSPPVLRAAIMSVMTVSAVLVGRRDWSPASLAASALIMTAVNPLLVHSVSFQLSIAATLALIVLQPRLAAWLSGRFLSQGDSPSTMRGALAEIVLATCAAQLMTLPIAWAQFGQVSILALLANLLVLPIQPLILVPGATIVLLGTMVPSVARILAYALWLPLRWTILVAERVGSVSWASLALPRLPAAGAWLIYALILVLIWRLPARRTAEQEPSPVPWRVLAPMAGWAAMLVLLWIGVATLPDGKLHVYALDVGQGDAILVRAPGGAVALIDGGADPLLLCSRLGQVLPFWEHEIDLVLVTHADADHAGGLPCLVSRYRVGDAVQAGDLSVSAAGAAWQNALAMDGVTPQYLGKGATVRMGGVALRVLHPALPLGHNEAGENDGSIVAMLEYGDFRMLLTGDAGQAVENRLTSVEESLQATVLKVSHHGAATATHAEFLAAVGPQLAVISVGAENRYGHPAPEVLQRLAESDVTVLRTDELGTIAIATDGARVWVESAR